MPATVTNPTPRWISDPSVFDPAWQRGLASVYRLLGLTNPQNQVTALMTPMEVGPSGGLVKLVGDVVQGVKAYHGSPRTYAELQPGSMMTTQPEWAAGYTTDPSWPGAGPDRFVGRVHAADVPFGDRVIEARHLHDAEGILLDRARQILKRPANTLREAADALATQGYTAIVARNAAGETTGIIPLSAVPVAEHLDPRTILETALREGKSIAGNLRTILEQR